MPLFQQESIAGSASKTAPKLRPPSMYKVLIHNDDYTTMEFVVHILETVFHKSTEEATKIMLKVHQEGTGLCGIYTHEIAETKVATVHQTAQQYEFPLRSTMERV